MTKTEWMNWVEEAWNKAQQSAWAEKREWVSLTDEEFDQVLKEFSHDPRAMAIELEIRIMEKNT